MRVGIGYDIHQLVEGRPLIMGGITIPFEKGLKGHSDGDALLHAIADALLGALAMGDIGRHFPDTDPANKNLDSAKILASAAAMVRERGYDIANIDTNIIAESPKFAPHIIKICERVAAIAGIAPELVSIKARTNEKLDAVGRGEAIAVQAIVALEPAGKGDEAVTKGGGSMSAQTISEETTETIAAPLMMYNTLTRKKEEFEPLVEGSVRMYACGITAYDSCHLGHARSALAFDIIYRYLKHMGLDVTFVRNFTDVDDKIINRANKDGVSCEELSTRYIEEYRQDMAALGVATPTIEPRATEHIADMIATISKLIDKGYAYATESGVYFSVRKFKGYGKLSGKNIEDLESGARVEVDEKKQDPLDFALWKASKPGEPAWESPWGAGRPGWHIECSAMSSRYLGQPFDIHGGGRDLIFPHHENEIAQAEGAEGKQFARYWLHNGFININAEKMSKSLGNITTIRAMLANFDAEVLRFFLISSHYRSPLDYTPQAMDDAKASLTRFYETAARVQKIHPGKSAEKPPADIPEGEELREKLMAFESRFESAMRDDFNTAGAIGTVFDLVRVLNRYLDASGGRQTPFSGWVMLRVTRIQYLLDAVLGVFGSDPSEYLGRMKDKGAASAGVDAARVEALIAERKAARTSRNFGRADEIRKELDAMGVELKDNPDGTTAWMMK